MLKNIKDIQLWVECAGEGAPLLVMHGGPGLDHTYFRPHLDNLAKTHNVIYYDHRGNGRSSPVQNWEGITHATWVEDADQLRASLGHEKIFLFGHSYGPTGDTSRKTTLSLTRIASPV